jgi:hypothetical protein
VENSHDGHSAANISSDDIGPHRSALDKAEACFASFSNAKAKLQECFVKHRMKSEYICATWRNRTTALRRTQHVWHKQQRCTLKWQPVFALSFPCKSQKKPSAY